MANDPRATPTIPRSHPGFIVSCVFGVIGLLLIITGVIIGGQNIFVAGTICGAFSLLAALAWRADLVSTWKRNHR